MREAQGGAQAPREGGEHARLASERVRVRERARVCVQLMWLSAVLAIAAADQTDRPLCEIL